MLELKDRHRHVRCREKSVFTNAGGSGILYGGSSPSRSVVRLYSYDEGRETVRL